MDGDDPAADNCSAPLAERDTEEPTLQWKLQRELADLVIRFAPLNEIASLLEKGAQLNDPVVQGLRPLHYAVYSGNLECVEWLIDHGSYIDAVDDVGYSALHLSAEHGNYELSKLLIRNFARVCFVDADKEKYLFPRAYKCEEPLRLAIKNGHKECARLLLENGANANARYFLGAEITMISPTDVEFLQLLLMYGADGNVYTRNGLTPLMRAARWGHKEKGLDAVKILLEYGSYVNAMAMTKQDLRTPLHYAVLSGSVPVVNFLLEAGASVNMPSDYDRPTPIDLAVLKDDTELLGVLLKAGADPNAAHTYIGSAVHLAVCSELSNQFDIIELLLKYGGDSNLIKVYTEGGVLKSPMVEYARARDQLDSRIIRLFLAYGGEVVMRSPLSDPRGMLRNLMKVSAVCPQLFELLLDAGRNFDVAAAIRLPIAFEKRLRIAERGSQPFPLKHICRLQIRDHMKLISPAKVAQLPLPESIKEYLLYQTTG